MNLQFHMPTRVIMGEGCIRSNSSVFSSLGKKALIVTGSHSARANGSLDDIISALDSEDIGYAIYDRVMSNPTIDCVYEGAALAKEQRADFIVAIGGGSPMDAAKAIALLACQDVPEEQLFSGRYANKILPMVFIPTTAGTGSEVTQYSILTNDRARTKTSLASPLLFPTVSFLDARYTMGLPLATTINTAIDALSHSVEGMLSVRANAMTDLLAMEGIRCISQQFDALKSGGLTLEAREKLLYASMLGGVVIAHTGTTAVHSMGYSLTYFKDIDHGRANGLLLAAFLGFVEREETGRVRTILEQMGYSKTVELKDTLAGLLGEKESITAEEFEEYSAIAIKAKNIQNSIVTPNRQDVLNMYKESFK